MARKFVAASSQTLDLGSASVTVPPFTLACWFKPVGVADAKLVALHTSGSDNHRHSLDINTGAVRAFSRTTTGAGASTTTAPLAGVWQHACGVFEAANSRSAYLNGGGKATNTTNKNVNAVNRITIGNAPTVTEFFDGLMAELGIWNAALNDGEVKSLALGVKPIFIRPMNLVAYWPLRKPGSVETDAFHTVKNNLLVTGALSVPYNPPAVFYPRRKRYFIPPVVVVRPPGSTLILNAVHRAASW